MLESVSSGFKAAKNFLAGERQLTESNIEEALRKVRQSLLEADVAFPVVKSFLERVKAEAIDKTVSTSLKNKLGKNKKLGPSEHFIGICYEALEALMGPVDTSIKHGKDLTTIMMVGLQGSGKTTTTGKLAKKLIDEGKKPLLVAADIYRPAAVEQLKVLGRKLDVPVFSENGVNPPDLCAAALNFAKENGRNAVLFDTAGRLAIDEVLMEELRQIKAVTSPDNIFLVADAMVGQDAVNTSAEFNRVMDVDGFILTKLDGDARGGAALSIKEVTGKPIKFLGMGEHLDNLEEFRPQGLASRILGMGDIVGLAQDFQKHVDEKQAEDDAKRMLSGQFTLNDFLSQIKLIQKMGSMKDLVDKMPGLSEAVPKKDINDGELVKIESMVLSMTPKERERPELFSKQKSRLARVAKGCGRKENDVSGMLKRFNMMGQMMQAVGQQPGLLGRLPGFKQFGQMSKMAKAYGGGNMANLMGQMAPAGASGGFSGMPGMGQKRSKLLQQAPSSKTKKNKRKADKKARKKNKGRR